MMSDLKVVSYGAEHEWADHPLDRDPPTGFGRDVRDITMVNSNGVANDPKGVTYRWGGEFNTPPTDTIEGQLDCLQLLKDRYPEATINYRSNLHLHVRVPGLKDNLEALKQFQRHIHRELAIYLGSVVERIPLPTRQEYGTEEEFQGAKRRYRRRCISHQCFLTETRLLAQQKARTVQEFFDLEPPQSKLGKPLFHLQPRVCVNLRQLLQTDTVEFRHFPGTMSRERLKAAFNWVDRYTLLALHGPTIDELAEEARDWPFPTFLPYHHAVETCYRQTVHDGTLTTKQIMSNVAEITSHKDLDQCRDWMMNNGYAIGAYNTRIA
jgi:hypothetical protein